MRNGCRTDIKVADEVLLGTGKEIQSKLNSAGGKKKKERKSNCNNYNE